MKNGITEKLNDFKTSLEEWSENAKKWGTENVVPVGRCHF